MTHKITRLIIAAMLIISIAAFSLSESEVTMPYIPQVKVGNTIYNLKDTEARNEITYLKSALNEKKPYYSSKAMGYFYGAGYFNTDLVFIENPTLVTLKIPLKNPSFVILSSPENFHPSTISRQYLYTFELEDGTLTKTYAMDGFHSTAATKTDGDYSCAAWSFENAKYVYILVERSCVDKITVIRNSPLFEIAHEYKMPFGITVINAANTANELCYVSNNAMGFLTKAGTSITALWITVNAGDSFAGIPNITGLSFKGSYHAYDGSSDVRINSDSFTCPKDGIVCIFDFTDPPFGIIYIPANRINLHKADIDDLDLSSDNPYEGMNAVAFGTSLTYRAQTTGGYLQYLPGLSGMTFDNQGIGSSKIKGNMLTAIKNYSNWSDKDVCTLEGFVNDFGYEANALGTWKDNTESTVCGCVRVALNYIISQNRNMTVFLILDHYGKNYGGVDSSSTFKNDAGDTQYEFNEEIAKVAESMGIPVIKLYAISQISENTPQYLMDNIHPTDLGARQTAYAIWREMKRYHPNQVSGQ